MTVDMARYREAVSDAWERVSDCGFEFGGGFAMHAPMAAEALARLGHADEVAGWVEENRRLRRYGPRPEPRWPIDAQNPADWRGALGDMARVADWSAMFERELAERAWPEVVGGWAPRLLPGMFGALGHGVIRTAHAARALGDIPEPTGEQLRELAQGLGYWAARYTEAPGGAAGSGEPVPDDEQGLVALTASAAGRYAEGAPWPPVPLVHTVTLPAAVHLLLPVIPADQRPAAVRESARAVSAMYAVFGSGLGDGPAMPEVPPLSRTIAEAVESGDEHSIKLAEACLRLSAINPDPRYPHAAAVLVRRLSGRVAGT